jgi:hypothetical protein
MAARAVAMLTFAALLGAGGSTTREGSFQQLRDAQRAGPAEPPPSRGYRWQHETNVSQLRAHLTAAELCWLGIAADQTGTYRVPARPLFTQATIKSESNMRWMGCPEQTPALKVEPSRQCWDARSLVLRWANPRSRAKHSLESVLDLLVQRNTSEVVLIGDSVMDLVHDALWLSVRRAIAMDSGFAAGFSVSDKVLLSEDEDRPPTDDHLAEGQMDYFDIVARGHSIRVFLGRCDRVEAGADESCSLESIERHFAAQARKRSVVVCNFGLHYDSDSRKEFSTSVGKVLQAMQRGAAHGRSIFLWQQTSSQHFYAPAGDFWEQARLVPFWTGSRLCTPSASAGALRACNLTHARELPLEAPDISGVLARTQCKVGRGVCACDAAGANRVFEGAKCNARQWCACDRRSFMCVPKSDSVRGVSMDGPNWRNAAVDELIERLQLRHLKHAIPLHAITDRRYDAHTMQHHLVPDCTHYCFSPFLWEPLWDSWWVAMQHYYTKLKVGTSVVATKH